MKQSRRYPSSTDVARLASVSQSAVSRTFTEGRSVSEETRKKVLKAAKKLGYSPNFLPRMLLKHRSNFVAVVISGTNNPFYALALEEFAKALQDTGHQVLLIRTDRIHSLDGVLPRLASFRVDAVVSALPVLSTQAARSLEQINIPAISFNTPVKNRWVASVCADSAGGAAAIADLFVTRGAKAFGYIAGSAGSHANRERLRGFRARLRRHGVSKLLCITGDYHYDGGYKAILSLKQSGPLPEAIFCGNDLMALGAMDALRYELGLSIPGDVLVAGFDDIPEASWKSYSLTTIVQDHRLMVASAMELLQTMMTSAKSAGGILRTVPGNLIERASTMK
ncbi:MAG: LacI family DNA-binding transcriptional regulator [Aestuariivirga sp.]